MPLSTYNGEWEELFDGSGQGEIALDGKAQRTFKIPWADLGAFTAALMGGFAKIGENAFYFTLPDQHPDWNGLYCQGTSYEGFGSHSVGGDDQIVYTYAKVVAHYTPLKFTPSIQPKDIITEDLDFSVEQISLPKLSYKNSSTSEALDQQIKKIIPTCKYTITLYDYPELPGGDVELIFSLLGKVNSTAFKGAAIKKMLFMGAKASRTMRTTGDANWQIELRFSYRDLEWTKVFDPATGEPVEVVSVVGGNPLYESEDLNDLLPS